MTQLSLTERTPPQPSPKASEQGENLARVSGRIAPVVLDFCRRVLALNQGLPGVPFRPSDVVAFLGREGVVCAPSSADRILRELRRSGFVSYTVINRAQSLYRLDGVKA